MAHLCNVTLVHKVNSSVVREVMDGFLGIPKNSPFLVGLFPDQELPSDHVSLYSGFLCVRIEATCGQSVAHRRTRGRGVRDRLH
jgi:hypothetical protein